MMYSCLFAQSGKQDLIYSAISKDSTIICYNEINGIKYEIIQIKTWNKDEKRFRINNEIIDTILINHYDWKIPFCYKQSVFFGEATNTKMPVYYKFNQNKIEKIEGVFLYDDFQKNAVAGHAVFDKNDGPIDPRNSVAEVVHVRDNSLGCLILF